MVYTSYVLTRMSGIAIATDVIVAVLPIPVIWRLNMKRRTRIYLVAILSVGWMYVPSSR